VFILHTICDYCSIINIAPVTVDIF